jgi:hypothetical protein
MNVAPLMRPKAASSRFASGRTIAGSLPPSSRVTFVRLAAAIAMIRLPPPTLPVKQTCLIRGSPTTIGPRTSSAPVTTFSTPGGRFLTRCRSVRTDDSGVVGGGFAMTMLPAISAYGRHAARIASGQLNG